MPSALLEALNLTPGQAISLETSALPGGALRLQAVADDEDQALPAAKFTSLNATTGTLAAGAITGANQVFLTSTNATPGAQTVRTAAQMFADTPGAFVGQTWTLRIANSGAGTFTLTADAGPTVTITGHAAVVTDTWVDYFCEFVSAIAVTIQSVGSGVVP